MPQGEKKTRAEMILAEGFDIELPDLEGGEGVWEAWRQAGYALHDRALPWSEVAAYARITGLTAEEALLVRDMSAAYVEGRAMTNPLSIAPMEAGGG